MIPPKLDKMGRQGRMSKKRNPIFLLVAGKVLYGSLTRGHEFTHSHQPRPHYGAYQLLIAYMSQSLLYHPISFAWMCMATMRPSDPKHILPTNGENWRSFNYHGRICKIKHHSKKQILVITGVPIPQSLLYHPIGFDVGNFLLGFGLSSLRASAEPFGLHKSKFI